MKLLTQATKFTFKLTNVTKINLLKTTALPNLKGNRLISFAFRLLKWFGINAHGAQLAR